MSVRGCQHAYLPAGLD